jgi:hypothetical protein
MHVGSQRIYLIRHMLVGFYCESELAKLYQIHGLIY